MKSDRWKNDVFVGVGGHQLVIRGKYGVATQAKVEDVNAVACEHDLHDSLILVWPCAYSTDSSCDFAVGIEHNNCSRCRTLLPKVPATPAVPNQSSRIRNHSRPGRVL